jgi:hypothetical protein
LEEATRHRGSGEYHAVAASPAVIGHYRLRPPEMTTTVRAEGDEIVRAPGPRGETAQNLRALYLLETDDHDSALDLAARSDSRTQLLRMAQWRAKGRVSAPLRTFVCSGRNQTLRNHALVLVAPLSVA